MTVHGAKGLEAPHRVPARHLHDGIRRAPRRRARDARRRIAAAATAEPFVWCVKGTSRLPAIAAAKAAEDAREAAERNRLLYVAMTRARDRLYVAGFEGTSAARPRAAGTILSRGDCAALEPAQGPGGNKVLRAASAQTEPHGKAEA